MPSLRPHLIGTYIVKAAESQPRPVAPRTPPPGYRDRRPDPKDVEAARAFLRFRLTPDGEQATIG